MRTFHRTAMASAAGLALLAAAWNPSLAATSDDAAGPKQLAHMSQGQSGGGGSPGMMGPGTGRQGMMAPGTGRQGMMGQGMMGSGTGCQGTMGQGMMPMMQQMYRGKMGQGTMGQGMMGPRMGQQGKMGLGMMGRHARVLPSRDISTDDVRHFLEHRLERLDNKRLKVGEVKQADDDTITGDVVTKDDSLVQRFEVDRHSGRVKRVD